MLKACAATLPGCVSDWLVPQTALAHLGMLCISCLCSKGEHSRFPLALAILVISVGECLTVGDVSWSALESSFLGCIEAFVMS